MPEAVAGVVVIAEEVANMGEEDELYSRLSQIPTPRPSRNWGSVSRCLVKRCCGRLGDFLGGLNLKN